MVTIFLLISAYCTSKNIIALKNASCTISAVQTWALQHYLFRHRNTIVCAMETENLGTSVSSEHHDSVKQASRKSQIICFLSLTPYPHATIHSPEPATRDEALLVLGKKMRRWWFMDALHLQGKFFIVCGVGTGSLQGWFLWEASRNFFHVHWSQCHATPKWSHHWLRPSLSAMEAAPLE